MGSKRALYYAKSSVIGVGFLVAALADKRIEYVGKSHHSRLERNVLAGSPLRIAASVPLLVVVVGYVPGKLDKFIVLNTAQDVLDYRGALGCMALFPRSCIGAALESI